MSFIGSINGKLRQFFNTHAHILDCLCLAETLRCAEWP